LSTPGDIAVDDLKGSSMLQADELWQRSASALRAQVSEATWNTCFSELHVVGQSGDTLVLAAPNGLVKDRIESRFAELLRAIVSEHDRTISLVRIDVAELKPVQESVAEVQTRSDVSGVSPGSKNANVVDDLGLGGQDSTNIDGSTIAETHRPPASGSPASGSPASGSPASGSPASGSPGIRAGRPGGAGDISLNARYTFEDFVIGQSNRFAHAAALAVAETPARSYNPLFIYGDSGLGKTHLLQAIVHYVHQNYPVMRIRYVSTETFVTEFVDAIRSNQAASFKRRYRDDCDVLLIDDIQFMEGKEGTQEEFFHTFNFLHNSGRQIVITSDRPPKSISTLEDRLRSRFEWGLITDIQPPDVETREAILRRKAERERVEVPADVLRFIATNVKDNIRELEGALNRVCAYAFLNGVVIDVPTTERVLNDLLSSGEPRPITSKVILDATAKMFGFSLEDLTGQSRRRPLVTARQIAMYAFRELTEFSYPMIGREFGGRDHTTVIHAVEKVNSQLKERRAVYEQVTELIRMIRSGG
jgi:chromosomal replication initiator protein